MNIAGRAGCKTSSNFLIHNGLIIPLLIREEKLSVAAEILGGISI